MANNKVNNVVKKTIAYVALIIFGLMMMLPFFWMVSTSFKPFNEIFIPGLKLIPKHPTFNNYKELFQVTRYTNLPLGFLNSLITVIPTVIIGVFTAALAAFGFCRMNFPGRDKIFYILICTVAIPGVVTMIPTYILFTKIKWIDSWLPLMIPGMFGSAMNVFLIRQFMRGIPKDLDEAAKVDGMSQFGIFIRIILPLSKPIIITTLLFGFIGGYNDYMGPLMYIRSTDKFTLQLALSAMKDTFGTKHGTLMAGSTIALVPIIIIFFVAQKFFIEGISISGMKN